MTEDPDVPETTGVPEVDDVLRDLEQVADRPVQEHVESFESAHRRLREVLDDPQSDSPA